MPAVFRRRLVGKNSNEEMFVTVIMLKYALLVSRRSRCGHFLKLIQFYLSNTLNLRQLTQRIISFYTHKMAIVSWPQTLWRHFTLYVSPKAEPHRLQNLESHTTVWVWVSIQRYWRTEAIDWTNSGKAVIQHLSEDAIVCVCVLLGSAETLVT